MRMVNKLLDVPSTDPDDARRRKLLNILLLGLTMLILLGLLATVVADIGNIYTQERIIALYLGLSAALVGLLLVFAINRYGSGLAASGLFLLVLVGGAAFIDELREVAAGRSLVTFAIPIVMASVLIRPYASFVVAGLSSLVIAAIAMAIGTMPTPFAMLTFFTIALASWLSARSLERTLQDLRILNLELDQRVQDRTQELAESLSRNQAILQSIADGVIVFDHEGKATVANLATASLLGQAPDEVIGCDIDTLMGEAVDPADQEVVRSLLKDKEKSYPAVKFQWGDKTLSVSFAPVRDASEEVVSRVAVFRDFTQEAEVERMKSAFVSMASHELRTPLNAIMGYGEMLQEGFLGSLSDEQHDTATRIVANARQLMNLVNNLLDRAQVEAGRLELDTARFAVLDLVEDVRDMVGVLARTKRLGLTFDIANNVPASLYGDRQRLNQILINLVGNAFKFTEKGAIRVRVYRPDAGHLALEVSDTGCGIPAEAQSHIFDPFWQVDNSVTREHAGFGLGLTIVKQLVDLMGGRITLASKVGLGSTFTVVLPLVPAQEKSL